MKVLIAGGGTGGHLYPALAIAKELKSRNVDVEFVGTAAGLETKIVPRDGFELHLISIGKLNQVSLKTKLKTLLKIPLAFIQAVLLILKFKPDVILGVGGYASGPALFVGSLLRRKTLIWEPNAFPGLANRLLSSWVDLSCVVFESATKHLKSKRTLRVPMPVRKEIEEMALRVPRTVNFRVLIFGGSQGSRAINQCVIDMIKQGGPWLKTTEFVHQTGSHEFKAVEKQYIDAKIPMSQVQCLEFLHDMPERYRWADLVIARSGTGTLSEIAACGKASILIPLPTAADDHQRINAEALVGMGGAKMILQKDLTPDRLKTEILALQDDPEALHHLEENAKKFHQAGAAVKMANIICEM